MIYTIPNTQWHTTFLPWAQRAQRHPTTFTYPSNCWHDIYNTNVNTNSPTSPHPTPNNYTYSPNCFQHIIFTVFVYTAYLCICGTVTLVQHFSLWHLQHPCTHCFSKIFICYAHAWSSLSKFYRAKSMGRGGGFHMPICIQIPNKYYMNCKWFPVSLLIVRLQWLSWIQILNCLKCQRFHTSSQAMSCDVLVMVVVFVFDLVVFLDQDMSPHHFD